MPFPGTPAQAPRTPPHGGGCRWWMRFFRQATLAPSLSMIAGAFSSGPGRPPGAPPRNFRPAIGPQYPRVPGASPWRKALFNESFAEELVPNRSGRVLVRHARAGTAPRGFRHGSPAAARSATSTASFSVYALPLSQPDQLQRRQGRPHHIGRLRRIYERPAARDTWAKGRIPWRRRHQNIGARFPVLELYTSEPNTFFFEALIALAEKRARFTATISMRPI